MALERGAALRLSNEEITRLKGELDNERHARELAERDTLNSTEQLRDARTEVARLREELQTMRAESEDAKIRLARIEGERQAEEVRRVSEKRVADQRAGAENLKQALAKFGAVRQTDRGLVLVLSESLWANPRSSNLVAGNFIGTDLNGQANAATSFANRFGKSGNFTGIPAASPAARRSTHRGSRA